MLVSVLADGVVQRCGSKLMSSPRPAVVGMWIWPSVPMGSMMVFRYSGGCVVVYEGVEEAAFVPASVEEASEDGEVAGAAAVDFAVHVEGFGEVADLHGGADASDVEDTGAKDVGGAVDGPLGAGVELTFDEFGSEDGDVEVVGEPDV